MTYTCVSIGYSDMMFELGFTFYNAGLVCRSEKIMDTVDFWDSYDSETP